MAQFYVWSCLEKGNIKTGPYLGKGKPLPKHVFVFTCPWYKSFENTAGKGETASTRLEDFLPISNLKLLSAHSFSVEEPKICRLGRD